MDKRLVLALLLCGLVLLIYSALARYLMPLPSQPEPEEKIARRGDEKPEIPPTEIIVPPPKGDVVRPQEEKEIRVETDLYIATFGTRGALLKSFRLKSYPEILLPSGDLRTALKRIDSKQKSIRNQLLTGKTGGGCSPPRDLTANDRERLEKEMVTLERRKEAVAEAANCLAEMASTVYGLKEALRAAKERGDEEEAGKLEETLAREQAVELIPIEGAQAGEYPLWIELPGLVKKETLREAVYRPDKDQVSLWGTDPLASYPKANTLDMETELAGGLKVTKRFTFERGSYLIGLKVIVENAAPAADTKREVVLGYGPGVGLWAATGQVKSDRGVDVGPVSMVSGKVQKEVVGDGSSGCGGCARPTMRTGQPAIREGKVEWAALRSKYFAAALIPLSPAGNLTIHQTEEGYQEIVIRGEAQPGDKNSQEAAFQVYLGPQSELILKQASPGLEKIVDMGWVAPIVRVLGFLLRRIYQVVGNYGLTIIILALMIKGAFYPLTHKSFESMRKMQEDMKKLQPKLKALKEKYQDNAQKLNKATMELYKREGVNPLSGCKGGCLPMLLQMPVFFALYSLLRNSLELRGAPLGWWVQDLSAPV